jgi:23S rRNA (adenine2503-C2)-methyltransferase
LEKIDIRSMSKAELVSEFEKIGEKKFRADQVYKWIASGVESFDLMTNISKPLREKLNGTYFIPTVKPIRKLVSAEDETVKYLYELYDGERIESVL